jgi:hypothetical protein
LRRCERLTRSRGDAEGEQGEAEEKAMPERQRSDADNGSLGKMRKYVKNNDFKCEWLSPKYRHLRASAAPRETKLALVMESNDKPKGVADSKTIRKTHAEPRRKRRKSRQDG